MTDNLLLREDGYPNAPSKAAPVWIPITAYGQVKVGDKLRFTLCGETHNRKAKLILNAGTNQEEIIYDKGRNYYLITSMAIAGKGSQKNVEFLADQPAAPRIDEALILAAKRTRDDLGETGCNYPDVRKLLSFVESAIAAQPVQDDGEKK